MAESEEKRPFRLTNQSLGQQPSLGPIPMNLLAPSGIILTIAYLIVRVILRWNFPLFLAVSIWGISAWWIVVGEKTWKFTNKFVPVPNWRRGHVRYRRYLERDEN
jgi:hypothetical protein